MRFRAPIIQPGLTLKDATDAKARYLKINTGAKVTIDSHPDNTQFKTLIANLQCLPFRCVIEPGFIGYGEWRCLLTTTRRRP